MVQATISGLSLSNESDCFLGAKLANFQPNQSISGLRDLLVGATIDGSGKLKYLSKSKSSSSKCHRMQCLLGRLCAEGNGLEIPQVDDLRFINPWEA